MHGETILCIDNRVWHSLWRDSQQIMSRMASDNKVYYVEHGRDPDRPHSAEVLRNWPNLFALRPQRYTDNLTIIPTPPCLPYARRHLPSPILRFSTPLVARVNSLILIRHVRWAMREFAIERPILWLYEPRHIDLVGKFGEKLVCYFNYDEMSDFAANARMRALLREYDNRLTRCADVVFTTSRGQWERRVRLNPHTYLTPNGVDFDLFNTALRPETEIPKDVVSIPRPIIGFAGWIGSQVDVDLLVHLADVCKDCSLVLVGPDCLPAGERLRQLRARRNVFFLGQKPVTSLPGYLKAFDVALIPYVIGGHTLTVYPLKLHEYLAAGTAIVATALPELGAFGEVVRIADDYDGFVRYVRTAIDDYSPEVVAARVAVARANTWDRRVADIYRVLEKALNGSLREGS